MLHTLTVLRKKPAALTSLVLYIQIVETENENSQRQKTVFAGQLFDDFNFVSGIKAIWRHILIIPFSYGLCLRLEEFFSESDQT